MSLVVIGTLAYDSIETPYDRRADALGGSALYFSVAAANFGVVRLVGVVGDDFKTPDLEGLANRGIDIRGVEIANGKTFRWSGRYEADWNTRHTLDTQLNVFEHFDPKLTPACRDASFVFLANAEPRVQMKALGQVQNPSFVVADTMNLWIDIRKDDLLELLARVDGVVLNDEEARMLTGEKNLIRAARKVLTFGPRYVILKKGEHGAFLIGEDAHFSLPAYPVDQVVDPTGAGDCFAGGFMGYVASAQSIEPRTLRRAMLYGTVTASFCVQGFSIEDIGKRTRSDVESRFNELLDITSV
ncbi:MAG: sugar kinase [Planctomycetes bacterium]|nr:sugar kinase [Planctomycetota bacterium]